MYRVSAQGVDECMINVHYYYYITVMVDWALKWIIPVCLWAVSNLLYTGIANWSDGLINLALYIYLVAGMAAMAE